MGSRRAENAIECASDIFGTAELQRLLAQCILAVRAHLMMPYLGNSRLAHINIGGLVLMLFCDLRIQRSPPRLSTNLDRRRARLRAYWRGERLPILGRLARLARKRNRSS